ncbi:LysE family translocator [Chitinasiproducens palmae]|nr:LysE family translocator [Chitinasiproducens palmae]
MSSTPGPNNLMVATAGANFGYRAALPQISGCILGIALQTMLACLGLGLVFLSYPALQWWLRIAGAAYLVFLAWKLTRTRAAGLPAPRPVSLWQAALFQGVNPKSWIRALTIASAFQPLGYAPLHWALAASVVGAIVGFPCLSLWTLFGVAIRNALNSPRRQRIFNGVMALALVALAFSFFR